MHVSEVMSTDVKMATPMQSMQDAARLMAKIDAGILPVAEEDRLVGMLTDRDIAVRGVAAGKPPKTPVEEIMSHEVKYCFDDDDIEEVAANMADIQLRRLPVVNRQKRLVGILSLADIAIGDDSGAVAGAALSGIAQPGGEHSQSGDGQRKFARLG